MSVIATIRPDSWNLPLLLHVGGAMVLVGALVLAASALVFAWPNISQSRPDISSDGSRVVFDTPAQDMVSGDHSTTNNDVFLYDFGGGGISRRKRRRPHPHPGNRLDAPGEPDADIFSIQRLATRGPLTCWTRLSPRVAWGPRASQE